MEKLSLQTVLSTDLPNEVPDGLSVGESNDSNEKTRSRAGSIWAAKKLPLRKFSCQNPTLSKSLGMSLPVQKTTEWEWKTYKGLVYGSSRQDGPSTKVALFDMDDTLIVNKLGRRVSDWEWFNPTVPIKLRALKAEGYRIVIASNQLGVSLGVVNLKDLQTKIQEMSADAGVEMSALLSTKKDKFRKPEVGMWFFVVNTLNTKAIEASNCFFVGDLAGRPAGPNRPKDQSDDDKKFALNCGLKFYTPEEMFPAEELDQSQSLSPDDFPETVLEEPEK